MDARDPLPAKKGFWRAALKPYGLASFLTVAVPAGLVFLALSLDGALRVVVFVLAGIAGLVGMYAPVVITAFEDSARAVEAEKQRNRTMDPE